MPIQELLDNIDLPLLVLDRDLQVRYATPSATRLTSLLPDQGHEGSPEPGPTLGIPDLEPRLRAAVDIGASWEGEVKHGGATCSLRIRPYRKHDQTIDGVVVLLVGLNPNRRADPSFEMARDFIDQLLATASHELRGPLGAIGGWVHVLSTGKAEPAVQREALAAIERGVRAEARLIEELADFARTVAGTVPLAPEVVDLASTAQAVVARLRPTADAKGVRLALRPGLAPALVHVDPRRLDQIVSNLVSNGIKFTPSGGEVALWVGRTDRTWELTVEDTGEGIEPSLLPHVFEYFQAPRNGTPTRPRPRLRRGLAVVRRLVELHGGEATAMSEGVGRGARVTLRLPVPALGAPGPLFPGSKSRSAREGGAKTLEGLRVVLVEDETDAREALTAVLEQYGASVSAGVSAADGLKLISAARPDVLVSDIGLPVEDGYAFIRRVRALPAEAGGNTPALALSAYVSAQDRLLALTAGFQAHLAKPAEPDELVAAIHALANAVEG